MYGKGETVSTFDSLMDIYKNQKASVEGTYEEWGVRYIAHWSHWFHWGSGMYSRFVIEDPPEDPEEAIRLHNRIWKTSVQAVLEEDGMVNEHHGVGLKLSRFMRDQYGDAWPFLKRIKNALDPKGIMNPGKVGFGR